MTEAAPTTAGLVPNTAAYDLMLLQLCFDVSEFDDVIVEAPQKVDEDQQQQHSSKQQQQLPAFDPFSFVASRQQHVALEQLESDLDKYAAHLSQSMLTCVHDEVYESFTHVAAQLGNTSKRLGTVKGPLAHTQRRIEASSQAVTAAVDQVNTALDEAVAAELERRFYAARVESALLARQMQGFFSATAASLPQQQQSPTKRQQAGAATLPSSPSSSQSSPTAQQPQKDVYDPQTVTSLIAEKLPGACQSMHRLDELVADMRSCMSGDTQRLEIAAFSEACASLERQLLSMLCDAFDSCYHHYNSNAAAAAASAVSNMQRVCELFCAVGRSGQFVDHFRDAVVRPLVEDVVSWRAASQARASPEDAAKLLDSLGTALEQGPLGLVPLLQQALAGGNMNEAVADDDEGTSPSSSATTVPLIIIACWAATSDTLMKRAIFLFNAGTPSAYYKHYVAANRLLAAHEAKCGDAATELCALRTCAEVALWTRKWNAEVYHALRQTELNETVNRALAAPDAFSAAPSSSSALFQTKAFGTIFDALKRTIDPDGGVFLFALQHRFLRDVFVSVQKLGEKAQSALSGDGESESSSSSSSSAGVVALWGRLRTDLQRLSTTIPSTFTPLLEAGTSGAWSDANSAILSPQAFVSLLVEEATAAVEQLDAVVKAGVVRRCMSNLGNVRLVPAAFTMTGKSVPSEPSPFTKNALAPLKSFHAALQQGNISRSAEETKLQQKLIEDVSSDILSQFSVVIKELVVSSRKAQESFENMKRAKASKAGGAAASVAAADPQQANNKQRQATDRDKILVQLHFDIDALAGELRSLGIHKERFLPFKALEALVKQRAVWVLSGFEGDEPEENVAE